MCSRSSGGASAARDRHARIRLRPRLNGQNSLTHLQSYLVVDCTWFLSPICSGTERRRIGKLASVGSLPVLSRNGLKSRCLDRTVLLFSQVLADLMATPGEWSGIGRVPIRRRP